MNHILRDYISLIYIKMATQSNYNDIYSDDEETDYDEFERERIDFKYETYMSLWKASDNVLHEMKGMYGDDILTKKDEVMSSLLESRKQAIHQIVSGARDNNNHYLWTDFQRYDLTIESSDEELYSRVNANFPHECCKHCLNLQCTNLHFYIGHNKIIVPPYESVIFEGDIHIGGRYLYAAGDTYMIITVIDIEKSIIKWVDNNGIQETELDIWKQNVLCESHKNWCDLCSMHPESCTCVHSDYHNAAPLPDDDPASLSEDDSQYHEVLCVGRTVMADGRRGTMVSKDPPTILFDETETPEIVEVESIEYMYSKNRTFSQCFANKVMYIRKRILLGELDYRAQERVFGQGHDLPVPDFDPDQQFSTLVNDVNVALFLPESCTDKRKTDYTRYLQYVEYIKTIEFRHHDHLEMDAFTALDIKNQVETMKYIYPNGVAHLQIKYSCGDRLTVDIDGIFKHCTFLFYNDTVGQPLLHIVVDDVGYYDVDVTSISGSPLKSDDSLYNSEMCPECRCGNYRGPPGLDCDCYSGKCIYSDSPSSYNHYDRNQAMIDSGSTKCIKCGHAFN